MQSLCVEVMYGRNENSFPCALVLWQMTRIFALRVLDMNAFAVRLRVNSREQQTNILSKTSKVGFRSPDLLQNFLCGILYELRNSLCHIILLFVAISRAKTTLGTQLRASLTALRFASRAAEALPIFSGCI